MTSRTIAKVYVFSNGMCIVFDQRGEQMPEYQGAYEELREKIERDIPEGVSIEHGEWIR